MLYNRHRAILLTLLMSTNIIAIENPQNNLPRRILIIAASAGILFLLARLVTNYFSGNNSFYSSGNISIMHQSTSTYGNIYMINDELTINPKNSSQQDLAHLPLIKPLGTLETIELNDAIEQVKIPSSIAIVHIDDAQIPRVERDAAFKDLIIKIDNGILTVSTPNNEPRKFAYNNKPLCTIYAALCASTLCASDIARVFIVNQKIDTLTSTNSSRISGSVQATHQLTLNCHNSSHVQLNNIKTESLTVESSKFSKVDITGTVNNQQILNITDNAQYTARIQGFLNKTRISVNKFSKLDLNEMNGNTLEMEASNNSKINITGKIYNQAINLSHFSTFDGSQLLGQGGDIRAYASNNSKIFVTGMVKNSTLNASKFSTIDGSQLIAQGDNLDAQASDNSKILVAGRVKNQTLNASRFSTIDGSQLIAQGDNLDAQASDNSKILVAGRVKNQTLSVSRFSTFDGSKLNVNTATIDLKDNSKASYLNIQEKLRGSAFRFSAITYEGTPTLDVEIDNFSKCVRKR